MKYFYAVVVALKENDPVVLDITGSLNAAACKLLEYLITRISKQEMPLPMLLTPVFDMLKYLEDALFVVLYLEMELFLLSVTYKHLTHHMNDPKICHTLLAPRILLE